MNSSHSYTVIIVGAGPGGLSVAGALLDAGLLANELLVVDRGDVGQSWHDYPEDTHLLSESSTTKDENMVAGVLTSEVLANIPHPSHLMYQKYLCHVAEKRQIPLRLNTGITSVLFDFADTEFDLHTRDDEVLSTRFLVWAAGMYTRPNESLDFDGCSIHYARMPYLNDIQASEITVVGSANGASGVVMQLARPGRKVHLVVGGAYVVPEPIDCLWKENMAFIKDLERQGLVEIHEHFRVKRIYKEGAEYILESEDGQTRTAPEKPITCTGFLPNIGPVNTLVNEVCIERETFLNIDEVHQSKDQPGLYFAGTIGRLTSDQAFIRNFREFAPTIASHIMNQSEAPLRHPQVVHASLVTQ